MGLDMYLSRKLYVKNWPHQKPEEQFEITVKKNNQPYTAVKKERISYIIEEVAYWRKANAIHNWFVAAAQNGNDDCGEYYVNHKQLVELRDLCVKVLNDNKLGPDILPTKSGFFFGDTEYDQYYLEDIKTTAEKLTEILKEPKIGDFVYHSSW